MAAGYGGGGSTNVQEQTTVTIEEIANLFESAYDYPLEIREIFDSRIARIQNLDLEISEVVRKTEREVGGFVTTKREFVYKDRSFVKSGQDYHIHYTSDNEEYFMSGVSHNKMSRLIFPINRKKTNHRYYNGLNKQSQLYISSETTTPTEEDYGNGSFTRYFAQKANNLNSELFEIQPNDYEQNNLFRYIEIFWTISGKKDDVIRINEVTIESESEIRGNELLAKILFPFNCGNHQKIHQKNYKKS